MIKFKSLLEAHGAGDWGTDEARKKLEQDTPGQGITDISTKNKERKESVELDEAKFKVGDEVMRTDKDNAPSGKIVKVLPGDKYLIKYTSTKTVGDEKVSAKDLYLLSGKKKKANEEVELDEATDFRPGDVVYQVGSKLKGTVLHKGNQDKIVVKFGSINKMISASQLRLAEEVELDEEKVIKIVADTNTRKYKEGEVIKTFPETRAGLTKAMVFQKTVKDRYGAETTMVRESVDLDEGAVAVSTVEKEIRKNGGTRVKKSDREITFMYKGSERKIPVDRGFVKSDHYMKIQDMMENLQERPFGGDSVLKDLMPGIYSFLDRAVNNRRYQFAVRMFLDLRKKNPNDARNNLIKAAKIADVDVRVLDRLFRDMVKKGVMPKHLMNYYPTFVEEITEKLKVSDGLGAWIKDFQDSDAPQFKDADSKKRRDMAIAAFVAAGGKLDEGSETWEAGYKRRVVKTTDSEHKEKGYNWRIKGKDRPEISIKLYKDKPSFKEFTKQMKRVAGHEFGG